MSHSDFGNILDRSEEIELTVKGRKSDKDISRPVWFVHEDNIVYLLPTNGSNTQWFKNVLHNPGMKISMNRQVFQGNGKPITDKNKVKEVVDKFRSKYGVDNIARYYTAKGDVMVEFSLRE
jgi:deazaflavin-dependent oxidoreductase (nitroreductase family)